MPDTIPFTKTIWNSLFEKCLNKRLSMNDNVSIIYHADSMELEYRYPSTLYDEWLNPKHIVISSSNYTYSDELHMFIMQSAIDALDDAIGGITEIINDITGQSCKLYVVANHEDLPTFPYLEFTYRTFESSNGGYYDSFLMICPFLNCAIYNGEVECNNILTIGKLNSECLIESKLPIEIDAGTALTLYDIIIAIDNVYYRWYGDGLFAKCETLTDLFVPIDSNFDILTEEEFESFSLPIEKGKDLQTLFIEFKYCAGKHANFQLYEYYR